MRSWYAVAASVGLAASHVAGPRPATSVGSDLPARAVPTRISGTSSDPGRYVVA